MHYYTCPFLYYYFAPNLAKIMLSQYVPFFYPRAIFIPLFVHLFFFSLAFGDDKLDYPPIQADMQ